MTDDQKQADAAIDAAYLEWKAKMKTRSPHPRAAWHQGAVWMARRLQPFIPAADDNACQSCKQEGGKLICTAGVECVAMSNPPHLTCGVEAVSDAAVLGWLNPDTGKTCSVDEKHSMEKHQGLPGVTIAKGFRIPLVAAGVGAVDGGQNAKG